MLSLRQKDGRFWFSILDHPLSRVLKFEYLKSYLEDVGAGECVLDYGSGDRPYEPLLLTKFTRYIAADYDVTNQNHDKRPDISITDKGLDIDADSVACVVMTEVLEHLYDPQRALRELHRVLATGGRLIGTVPFVVGEHEEPHDFYRFTRYSLQRMFTDAGFHIVKLDYVGDNVAVCLVVTNRLIRPIVQRLRRMGLWWIASPLNLVTKMPEAIYLTTWRMGLDLRRIKHLRQLPVGFAFCLEKPAVRPSSVSSSS